VVSPGRNPGCGYRPIIGMAFVYLFRANGIMELSLMRLFFPSSFCHVPGDPTSSKYAIFGRTGKYHQFASGVLSV